MDNVDPKSTFFKKGKLSAITLYQTTKFQLCPNLEHFSMTVSMWLKWCKLSLIE